jgi:hypothetical protein
MLIKPKDAVLRSAALAVVVVFAGATFKCAAEEALASGHQHEAQTANHHGHSDADHGDQHDNDSGNCCSSLKTPVPSSQQFVPKLNASSASFLVLAALLTDPPVVAPAGTSTLDHGPPGGSPPVFLSVSSLSPRSPPALV